MNVKSPLLCMALLLLTSAFAYAQSNSYGVANQLMQQQKYEEALPILEDLYTNNPDAFIFFDRYIECLVNLRKFDEAIEIAETHLELERSEDETRLKLAEVYHLNGDKEKAEEQWMYVLEQNPSNIQMYYKVASSMTDRNEYVLATEVYKSGQNYFEDQSLFMNELANTYMQAGQFENAVNEYFNLVVTNPDRVNMVQQRLLRMRDDNLYQIAAFELEDRFIELDHTHIAYPEMYQLLVWLLVETNEYSRAHTLARQYENQTSHTVYSLFSLGNQLASAGEYELAADAYEFYLDTDSRTVRYRAMEELSSVYVQQAQYLIQNNLESSAKHRELYENAYRYSEKIIEEFPQYDRIDRIYSTLIDISLDQFKDAEKAENWYRHMVDNTGNKDDAYALYAEGRLALFNKDFTTARQTLTRADRATGDSNLSERARYYLSLSDFYAGDFEFAGIQLRSLERRHTSFYSNDAIKLRMWINNGQRADTTGSVLSSIGESMYALHTSDYEVALKQLEPTLASPQNPFYDDLTVQLSTDLPEEYASVVLYLLNRVIESRPDSPLLERMMWDRAVLTEQMYESGSDFTLRDAPYLFSFIDPESSLTIYLSAEERFFGRDGSVTQISRDLITNLYEDLILEFPDGFYASHAREKLQTLQLTARSIW